MPGDLIAGNSPRNPWSRVMAAMALAKQGRLNAAQWILEQLRYHPNIAPEVASLFENQIARIAAAAGHHALINTPQDYLSHPKLQQRAPFAKAQAGRKVPSPFPPGLVVPSYVGADNETQFLYAAATQLRDQFAGRLHTAQVFISAQDPAHTAALLQDLSGQSFDGTIRVTVFGGPSPELPASFGAMAATGAPVRLEVTHLTAPLLGLESSIHLREVIEAEDDSLCVFLTGPVRLDRTTLARAAHVARATDMLVQPLITRPSLGAPQSDVTTTLFANHTPFHDMQDLNVIVSSGLLRRVGLPDTRFRTTAFAAREWVFRMGLKGAYTSPLAVSYVPAQPFASETHQEVGAEQTNDRALYLSLCPDALQRKADDAVAHGPYERPRVSIYIPAYNAERYLRQAIDSVLAQDFQDLEVCICNDGSTDSTAALLEASYRSDPRVRWVDRRNGGIGTASNAAIHLSRAPYIGQLDSDDVLKPGAVRRLVEYLDEHPDVSCVYGSCERIDADGHYVKNEYSWPQFSREKLMITSIVHHFRMFRRSRWERTEKFREDIVNGIDYDIFLKLAETGPMHHIDEIMYQRRWHGQNTSMVNENHQTANTHRVQTQMLRRLGLDRFWELYVADPEEPRRVTYRRKPGVRTVLFWPDYTASNPYQTMFYAPARGSTEILSGDIDAALEMLGHVADPAHLSFHLHGLDALFADVAEATAAQTAADQFLGKLQEFVAKGGELLWTIHGPFAPETPGDTLFADIKRWLSQEIAGLAHRIHLHSLSMLPALQERFEIPEDKIVVLPHGSYEAAYPDCIDRDAARDTLGLGTDDIIIVCDVQDRSGAAHDRAVTHLIESVARLRQQQPHLKLVLMGQCTSEDVAHVTSTLSAQDQHAIWITGRSSVDQDAEIYLRAADLAVILGDDGLTLGSLMLALSFNLRVVTPSVSTADDLRAQSQSITLYDQADPKDLERAITQTLIPHNSQGQSSDLAANAQKLPIAWQSPVPSLFGSPNP